MALTGDLPLGSAPPLSGGAYPPATACEKRPLFRGAPAGRRPTAESGHEQNSPKPTIQTCGVRVLAA